MARKKKPIIAEEGVDLVPGTDRPRARPAQQGAASSSAGRQNIGSRPTDPTTVNPAQGVDDPKDNKSKAVRKDGTYDGDYNINGKASTGTVSLKVGTGCPNAFISGLRDYDHDLSAENPASIFCPHEFPPIWSHGKNQEDRILQNLAESQDIQSRLPARLEYGTLGTNIALRTNHFWLDLNPRDDRPKIFKYTVTFKAEEKASEAARKAARESAKAKTNKGKNEEQGKMEQKTEEQMEAEEVKRQLTTRKRRHYFELLLQHDFFNDFKEGVATDFENIILTCKDLEIANDNSKEFDIPYVDPHEVDVERPERVIHQLVLKSAGKVPVLELLKYLDNPNAMSSFSAEMLQQTLQELQSILIRPSSKQTNNFSGSKSTRFYPWQGATCESFRLETGVIALKGYYASVRRSTSRVLANVNVCTSAFYEHGNLAEIMRNFIEEEGGRVGPRLMQWILKLRVQRVDTKRVKVIHGVKEQDATQYIIELTDDEAINGKTRVSVQNFFEGDKHKRKLLYPHLPLINVGSKDGTPPCYLPAELLDVLPGQTYRKKLGAGETQMARFGARPPAANAQRITDAAEDILGLFLPPELFRRCGLRVKPGMLTVNGRILGPPKVEYAAGITKRTKFGQWNMTDAKFIEPVPIKNWSFFIIYEGSIFSQQINDGIQAFQTEVKRRGLGTEQPKPYSGYNICFKDTTDDKKDALLRTQLERAAEDGVKFLLVILPSANAFIYSRLKYWADTVSGIHTVCCTPKTIFEKKKEKKQDAMANMILKVNLRLGGKNHKLPDTDLGYLQNKRTMIVGIDVTHPAPGSMEGTKSIAAIVASRDNKTFAQWPARLRLQTGKEEIVAEIREMIEDHLKAWREYNGGALPDTILVYRDGVAETQYDKVISDELQAIDEARQALYSRNEKCEVIMIVVGKRHHVRFYPTGNLEEDKVDLRSGNCKHGTIVDRGVTMEKGWDFYLQAHAAIKGTAKPAHYVVVRNEAGRELTANNLEQLTHNLCYLFGRATKAVSICPPVYYADLACSRGRAYLQKYLSAHKPSDKFDVELSGWRPVAEDLKDTMFYI